MDSSRIYVCQFGWGGRLIEKENVCLPFGKSVSTRIRSKRVPLLSRRQYLSDQSLFDNSFYLSVLIFTCPHTKCILLHHLFVTLRLERLRVTKETRRSKNTVTFNLWSLFWFIPRRIVYTLKNCKRKDVHLLTMN